MSDTELRDLERRWKATGSLEDEAAYLRARLRLIDKGVPRRTLGPHGVHEGDGWTTEGPRILSPENLALLTAEEGGELIVEHRHYRGASAPSKVVFDSVADLLQYLHESACWGDSIWVWSYSALCRDDNALARGKVEDDRGRVPLRGAY